MAQEPRIGGDPLSLGPAVTAEAIGRAWDGLMERAKKLTAPKEALQDFYKTYAAIVVGISANAPVAELLSKGSWQQYSNQIDALSEQYPAKSIWPWVAAAAAVGGWWMYRRSRRRVLA